VRLYKQNQEDYLRKNYQREDIKQGSGGEEEILAIRQDG
jgi:hypothetical protein